MVLETWNSLFDNYSIQFRLWFHFAWFNISPLKVDTNYISYHASYCRHISQNLVRIETYRRNQPVVVEMFVASFALCNVGLHLMYDIPQSLVALLLVMLPIVMYEWLPKLPCWNIEGKEPYIHNSKAVISRKKPLSLDKNLIIQHFCLVCFCIGTILYTFS